METSELGRVLDELSTGGAGVEDLDALASKMTADDLTEALARIKDRLTEADEEEEASRWTRTLSSLLLRYSLHSEDGFACELAETAADLLKNDLSDPAAAEVANSLAAVLKLDPVRLVGLYERIADSLGDDQRIRLLRAITTLGEPDETGRFRRKLEELTRDEGALDSETQSRLDAIREILDSDGGDPEEALRLLERLLDDHPSSVEALRLIARALIETGRSKKVEAWFVRALGAVEDDEARAPILSDLGFIQLGPLEDAGKALGSFEAALEADNTHEAALTGYLQAMNALDRIDDAVPLLEQIRRDTAGRPQEARVLPVLADAYKRQGRMDEAERTWRRLRAIDPRNAAALRFYEDLHESREDYQKLFTTLQFALSVVDEVEEKVRINKKMADVAENRLHNLERALDAHKRSLALDPLDEESREAVVTLYEKTSKWHALVEFYNEQLRRLPAEEVEARVGILFRIIEIYQDDDKFPNEDNVLANYARIVEISPTHMEALDTLAKGYESRKRWPDLLRVLQKKVSVTEEPEELLDLFHQIAEVAITRMSNETQAIPFLEKILELDPQNLDVVRKLKDIYQRKHNQEKLFSMHLKELEMQEGEDRESILAAAAVMARDRLLRYEDALRLYEELYEINPDNADARENLHMLYTRLERWSDYAEFLGKEVTLPMPDKRKMELRHKLGEVLMDRLGDAASAKEIYESILEDDPKDDRAARRLENVFLEQEDLDALKAVFAGRDDVRSFVALLAQRESREKDDARKVALNLAMADACEKDLDDPSRASRYLEKAWALDKTLVDVGRKLLASYEEHGNPDGSVKLLMDLAPVLEDPNEKIQAWSRLHRDLLRLNRPADAFKAGVEAVRLALSLGEAEERLDELRQTAEHGAFWQEYTVLLNEVAEATMDHEKRVGLLLELGTVYKNRLLFHDEAREALDRVLDLDGGNVDALGMLEDIALQREDYVGLESVLRRRIDVAGDPEQVRDIQLRLGRLYEDLLGDDLQAAECYMQVLQANPDDREVLGGLHRTYERSEKFMELADVIRMEAKAAVSDAEVVRLTCELSRVCWQHMDDYDEALRLLAEVLEKDPGCDDALGQLDQLFEKGLAREDAANILAPFYRVNERFDELEKLLEARLSDMDKAEAKAAIHLEIADIRARIKGDADGGFESVATAVELHPLDGYVERLFELADEAGRHREAAVTVGQWVGILPEGVAASPSTLPDAGTEARLALLLGRLYADKLDDPALAIKAFEKALPFEEEDEKFIRELLALYLRTGDLEAAMTTYDRLADSLTLTGSRRDVLMEKASVAREAGLTEKAMDTLRAVLDAGEDDAEAASELEDLLAECGRWEELVRLLERMEQTAADPSARAQVLYRMAVVQRDQLDRADLAADLLRRSLSEDPSMEEALLSAEALVQDSTAQGFADFAPPVVAVLEQVLRQGEENIGRLINVLSAKAGLASSAWEKSDAWSDVASLEKERGDPVACYEAMKRAFGAMTDDKGLLERTLEAGREAKRTDDLVDSLSAIAEEASRDAGVRILLAVAGLCRHELKEPQRARGIYDRLLEMEPGSMDVLGELDELLHEMGQEAERIPLLEEMAANARSIEEKRSTQVHIGELSHSTGDLEGAVNAYRFVLDRRPDEKALDDLAHKAGERLIGLCDTLGRTKQVVELRLLMGRASKDPETTRAHLLTAAILAHDEVRDLPAAAQIFDELLELDANDVAALDWAKRIAKESEDASRLQELVEMELAQAGDDDSRMTSLMELAAIHAANDDGRVLEPLKTVLEMDPAHEGAREMASGFLDSEAFGMAAAELLEAAAQRSDDAELMARALAVRVEGTGTSEEKTVLRERLAGSLSSLDRGDESVRILSEGYREDPEAETLFKALVEGLKSAGRLSELATLTAEAASRVEDAARRIEIRRTSAVVLTKGELPEKAIELLEANTDDDPAHVPTLELLGKAYEDAGRKDGVLRTLEMAADAAAGEKEKADAFVKCARFAETELEDVSKAAGYYRKVIDLFPLHDEAVPGLTGILEAEGDRDGLRDLRRSELRNLEGHDSVGDTLRVASLRRLLAMTALEDGDFEEAADLSIALVGAKQPEPDDMATARKVYSDAENPPALFHALVDAYQRTVERDDLLELYRFTAGMELEEPDRKSSLIAATELEEVLEKDDLLFDDLGELVIIDAEDATLRERFEAVGRRLGRLAEVKDVLVKAFGKHQDSPATFELAYSIARLLRDDLDSEEEAVEYLRVAFLRKPEDSQVVESLATLYEKLSRFGDLALLYENIGDMEEDGERRIALYFRAFDVIRNQVKDPVSAVEVLKKILDQDPTSGTALDALEAIARETNDPKTLAQSLASKADVTTKESERQALSLELAQVQDTQMNLPDGAIDTLTGILDVDPRCEKAREHLQQLYVKSERYAELADLYEQAAEIADGLDDKAEALKKASAVHETYLDDRPMAISLLRRLLELDPQNDYAFTRLTGMLEAEEDHNALAELLKGRLALAKGVSEQVDLNVRIGRVLVENKEDFQGAVTHLKAALAMDPYREDAREIMESLLNRASVAMDVALALETVYEASGEQLKLCDVLRRETGMVETAPERETLLLRVAQVQVERLDDSENGLATLGEALAQCPSNTETLETMKDVAGSSGQNEKLFDIIAGLVAGAELDAETSSRLHFEAARIADHDLKSPEKAAVHYAEFLSSNEGHSDTLAALDRVYSELGRTEELADVLRKRIGQGGDASEIDLRKRLAELLAGRMEDAEGALDQLRQVLDLNPGDKEAIRQLSNLTDHPVSGALALDLLTGSLRDSDDDEGLLWAIESQIQRGGEETDRTSLHAEAANIAGKLGKTGEQVAHLGAALAFVPSNETILANLLRIAKDHGMHAEAFRHLQTAADAATWEDLEKSLRLQAGMIAVSVEGLEEEMESCLKRVIEIDPMSKEAIDALDVYYEKNGRAKDLIGILELRLKLDMSQSTRIATLDRIAELSLMRKEEKRAAEALEEASSIDPSATGVLKRLCEVYEQSGDTRGKVSTLERLAAASTEMDEKVRCLLEAAGLQAGTLKDKQAARNTLEVLFGIDPTNVVGRGKLEDLYEELGEWEPLIGMLNQVIEGEEADDVRIEAALKAASVAETHVEDLAQAASHLEKARGIRPDSPEVLDEAIRLYYRLEDWTGLVDTLRHKAGITGNEPEKVALLAKACDIAQVKMGDPDLAATLAREVLAIDDTNAKALLVTARMMESKEEYDEALDLFRRLSGATGDMDERAQALLGVARILMARGDGGDEARESLQAARRIKPDHPEVNRYLKELYSHSGDYSALVEVMQKALKQAGDDVERSTICMDIAEIYRQQLNDGAKFLQWADEALRFKSDDPRIVEGIVDFHLKAGEVRKAVPHLEWLVNYMEGKRRLRELPPYAFQLGKILEASGDVEKAIQYYRLCHDHDAKNIPNALALGRLYMSGDQHEKALRVYQPLMVRIDSLEASGRVEVLLALARINARAGDKKKARQYVLRVLAEEPENVEAQALLSKGL